MPFSTTLLAEFIEFRTAFLVYCLNLILLTVTLFFAWRYAKVSLLLKDSIGIEMVAAIDRRIVTAISLYTLSAALCIINIYWSIAFIFLVQLNYAIAPRFERRAHAKRGDSQT